MTIKGYWTSYSYMGYVDGSYREFVSEEEYYNYISEVNDNA